MEIYQTLPTWDKETFEDYVETALIASFETRLAKNRDEKLNSASESDLVFYKRFPPFIPGVERIVLDEKAIDVVNDGFIDRACLVFPGGFQSEKTADIYKGYLSAVVLKRVDKIKGKHWIRMAQGRDYKMTFFNFTNKVIRGVNSYFTVLKNGQIIPFDQQISNIRGYFPGQQQGMIRKSEYDFENIEQVAYIASFAMQFYADKKNTWSITARESGAEICIGCSEDEIKSLLYARDLPLTATGRKRPILHLVNSHHRRLKNGTDIDISDYLRGINAVTIKNTEFIITPSDVLLKKINS